MTDKLVELIDKELSRMHDMLACSVEGDLEYNFALEGIERLQCCLLPEQQEDIVETTINELLRNAPTGDAQ